MTERKPKQHDLSPVQESYIECIADAERQHGHAHVSLLAAALGVKKPSVVQMLSRLVLLGVVRRDGKEVVLTNRGRRIASTLDGRHALLEDFMVRQLKMSTRAAAQEACRLEHAVSPRFIRGLRAHVRRSEKT